MAGSAAPWCAFPLAAGVILGGRSRHHAPAAEAVAGFAGGGGGPSRRGGSAAGDSRDGCRRGSHGNIGGVHAAGAAAAGCVAEMAWLGYQPQTNPRP